MIKPISFNYQVIEETLSPTWDELLILHEVTMYGLMQEIADSPPTIIVEVFDQDKVVCNPEFSVDETIF